MKDELINSFDGQSARIISKWFNDFEIKSEAKLDQKSVHQLIQRGANVNFILLEAAKRNYLSLVDVLIIYYHANPAYAIRGLTWSRPELVDNWIEKKKFDLAYDEMVRSRILATAISGDKKKLFAIFKKFTPKNNPRPNWFVNVALEGAGIGNHRELISILLSMQGELKFAIKGLALSYRMEEIEEYGNQKTPLEQKTLYAFAIQGLATKGDLELLDNFLSDHKLTRSTYVNSILLGGGAGAQKAIIDSVRPYNQSVAQDFAMGAAVSEGHFDLVNHLLNQPYQTRELAIKSLAVYSIEFGFMSNQRTAIRMLNAVAKIHRPAVAMAIDKELKLKIPAHPFKVTELIPRTQLNSSTFFKTNAGTAVYTANTCTLFLQMVSSCFKALFSCFCCHREVAQPGRPSLKR